MTDNELQVFISHRQTPCVSIIAPVHSKEPQRRVDEQMIRKAVQAARELIKLEAMKHSFNYHGLWKQLEELVKSIDFMHLKQGVGIFCSPDLSGIIHFPFSVPRKIRVENHFCRLEFYYYLFAIRPYHVLAVQQEEIHLYQGEEEILTEVHDEHYPMYYEEEYEYAKTDKVFSHGSTVLKQYEKDTSALRAIRRLAFYRKADEGLDSVVKSGLPILLTGNKQELSDFMQHSRYSGNVTGQIKGNYTFKDTFLLGKKCWEELNQVNETRTIDMLQQLPELVGNRMMVSGFSSVWRCLKEGNALELIIDKEHPHHVYLDGDGTKVFNERTTREKHVQLVLDPHERLIDLALKKGGKVTFTPPGALRKFGGVSLLLHYPDRKEINNLI
jgi:hypothetical protein